MTVESPLPTESDAAATQPAEPQNHSALSPEGRSEAPGSVAGRKVVAPLLARRVEDSDGAYEVVDAHGLVLTRRILGQHSARAIATTLERYVRGDGVCLRHLTETFAGRCVPCLNGWMRHTFSVEAR